jgi:hypothetical protein
MPGSYKSGAPDAIRCINNLLIINNYVFSLASAGSKWLLAAHPIASVNDAAVESFVTLSIPGSHPTSA